MKQTFGVGRNGKKYIYYQCRECKKNVSEKQILEDELICLNKFYIRLQKDKKGRKELELGIESLKNKKQRLINNQQDFPIPEDDFYKLYHNIDQKILALKSKLEKLAFKERRFSDLTNLEKKEIVEKYIDKVSVFYKNGTTHIKIIKKL